MDDKTTPTPSNPATPPSTPPLTAPPISPISSPSMSPTPSSPAAKPAPAAPIEMEKPVEHDIVSPANTPAEPIAPVATPEFAASEPIPSNQPAIPPVTEPATNAQPAQSTPAASTIPPMPPLETQPPNPATPSAPTPAPQPMAPNPTPSPEVPAEAVKADQTPSDVPISTNQTPSQDQTTPAEPDKAKKSKALIGIIIALVLIALILGGLVIWRAMQPTPTAAIPEAINEAVLPPEMQQAQEPEQIVEEIVEEEIVAEPTDPTADWITYKDNDFSFKYPDNWGTLELGQNNETLMIAPQEEISKIEAIEGGFDGGGLIITLNKSSKMPLIQSDEFQKVTTSQVEINNVNATQYELEVIQSSPLGEVGTILKYVVMQNKDLYYSLNLQNNLYLDYFNQILSTFEFTD